MARHFDDLHAGRPTTAPFLFLEGAGGTGKSFLFSCLEVLAYSIGRRIAPTALTGVACTAIPTDQGARTTQSCFKLGIDASLIGPLGDETVTVVKGLLGDTVAVIIDEISFSKAWILGAVDRQVHCSHLLYCLNQHSFILPHAQTHETAYWCRRRLWWGRSHLRR
jgi:hypothetical protein